MTLLDSQKRILIVEDEEALLATLRDELEQGGFAVDPAVTGEEALRKLEDHPPDAVILDLLLPYGVDGMGVLARLKQSERLRDIPVIMLTNVGDDESVREALELGADAYFQKTRYSLAELLERLHELLKTGRG